jgi:hypothetical protein
MRCQDHADLREHREHRGLKAQKETEAPKESEV